MKRSTSSAARKSHGSELYDVDFLERTERTAEFLRQGRFKEIDVEHVAQEIEDMGKRDLREVNRRLRLVLVHLLKWKWQPRRHLDLLAFDARGSACRHRRRVTGQPEFAAAHARNASAYL